MASPIMMKNFPKFFMNIEENFRFKAQTSFPFLFLLDKLGEAESSARYFNASIKMPRLIFKPFQT